MQYKLVWSFIITLSISHLFFIYGAYLWMIKAKWASTIFTYYYGFLCGIGITAGTHRLWTHRTYSANFPLRVFLMLLQSANFHGTILNWSRDHRTHHKFTDTNADPHNSKRGVFFSHIGWIMVRKNSDVIKMGKTIDMSDIAADPVVKFQSKYYFQLVAMFGFVLPTFIQCYFWKETVWISFWLNFFRLVLMLHVTAMVNSVAHLYGNRPYDNQIRPTENAFVSYWALGEGWHNYHHVFPWDYKTGELGNYGLNWTTAFLDLMAKIGWATELKTVSPDIIKRRRLRTGDGHTNNTNNGESGHPIWGWGDQDMDKEEILMVKSQGNYVDERKI